MNSYVIGVGKSGVAAARLLHCQGWQVTVSDRTLSEAAHSIQDQLVHEGIAVKLGHSFVPEPTLMRRVVVSPGVPWDAPMLEAARAMGIETIGEMELAWRSLQDYPWIGITGTNGKTTVTSLIAAIFQSAGLNAPACGNIGYAACQVALDTCYPAAIEPTSTTPNALPLDWVIAEISSYQIEASVSLAPQIGVWTTFTPDHLSRHKTMERYFEIKAQLLYQSRYQVLNGDDPFLRDHAAIHYPDAYWTSTAGRHALMGAPERGAYIESGIVFFADMPIVPVQALRMVGTHNHQNLLMAVATARLAGIESEAIAQAIATFPGVAHRLEHICTWKGIDFINDSKATNYDAADVGLRSVAAPAILIAGGEAKEGDDTAWIATIQQRVSTVLLIGSAAAAFAQRLDQVGYSAYEIVETLERAIPRATELAQRSAASVVLLSPACASFDQYANFEARGNHFRQICQEMFNPPE